MPKKITHLETAVQNARRGKGRHPMLKLGSALYKLYLEIEQRQPITASSLAHTLGMKYNTVRELVRKLKNEGLVLEAGVGMTNAGKIAKLLQTCPQNETGHARDDLVVQVTVYVNEYGEYSAKASIANQSPYAEDGNPQPVHSKEMHINVPRPDEVKTRQVFGNRKQNQLIIDN